MEIKKTDENEKHALNKYHMLLSMVIFGLLLGILTALCDEKGITATLIGLLFTFIGGSLVALFKKEVISSEARYSIITLMGAISLGAIVGLSLGFGLNIWESYRLYDRHFNYRKDTVVKQVEALLAAQTKLKELTDDEELRKVIFSKIIKDNLYEKITPPPIISKSPIVVHAGYSTNIFESLLADLEDTPLNPKDKLSIKIIIDGLISRKLTVQEIQFHINGIKEMKKSYKNSPADSFFQELLTEINQAIKNY